MIRFYLILIISCFFQLRLTQLSLTRFPHYQKKKEAQYDTDIHAIQFCRNALVKIQCTTLKYLATKTLRVRYHILYLVVTAKILLEDKFHWALSFFNFSFSLSQFPILFLVTIFHFLTTSSFSAS